MTTVRSFYGVVATAAEPTTLDGERGICFWVHTAGAHDEAAQVFVPVSRADQVDEVSLAVGAELSIDGVLLGSGVIAATALRVAPHRVRTDGRVLGTVGIHVPDLARLDPRRERRYLMTLWGGIAVVVALGATGTVLGNSVGVPAFVCLLALCGYLVWHDLHTRRVDSAEYAELAQVAAAAVRAEVGVVVPQSVMFTMLGGGLERTGNPWRPTQPRQPGPASWLDVVAGDRFAVAITPQPLQPNGPATITITVPPEEPNYWDG